MPIYEFRCDACGTEFEALVEAGAEPACAECGAPAARRVYSAPAAPFRLVKPRGEARKQERRNAQLHDATKSRFKQARARQRAKRAEKGDGKR